MVTPTQYNPNYIPQRGDVVNINLGPRKGIEIKKPRPALVLSPKVFNRSQRSVLVCPITSKERKSEFLVKIPDGLAVKGSILVDQFITVNWDRRKTKPLCYLPDATVDAVAELVEAIVSKDEHDPYYIPVRGEVVEIEGEFKKRHPALVLSTSGFNYWQRVSTICPIINPSTGSVLSKFAVEIPSEENVDVKGVILADQVKSQDWWARSAKHLGYLSDNTVNQVSDIVEAIVWGD